MNILHHKSWHVRNKDNIERVRRDEAKAAEEEKERQRRKALAESEARTELLRSKSRKRLRDEDGDVTGDDKQLVAPPTGHINFFKDEEDGTNKTGTNAECEAEKREEKEKQEKAIGLLTYLGQSAVEAQNEKPWYFKPPEKKRKLDEESNVTGIKKEEFDLKHKWSNDPMKMMRTYINTRDKVIERDKGSQSKARSQFSISWGAESSQSNPRSHSNQSEARSQSNQSEARSHSNQSEAREQVSDARIATIKGQSSLSSVSRKHRRKEQKKKKKKEHKKERKHKHKKKKKKKSRSSSDDDYNSDEISHRSSSLSVAATSSGKSMQQLRAERLRREQSERAKAEQLLSKHRGDPPKQEEQPINERESTRYNSQFNPELVRRKKKRNPGDLNFDKL